MQNIWGLVCRPLQLRGLSPLTSFAWGGDNKVNDIYFFYFFNLLIISGTYKIMKTEKKETDKN